MLPFSFIFTGDRPLTYGIIALLGRFIRVLPDGVVTGLARTLARLFFDVLRLRRRLVLANIATAFPERDDKEQLARASYAHFLLTVFEFISARPETVLDTVTFEGTEHLSGITPSQGGFVLCCHTGNWEVLSAAMNREVNPTRVIVKKLSNPGAERFVSQQRAAIGMDVVERKHRLDAVKAIRRAIGNGTLIGFVLDQARIGEPRIPFFTKPAKTNTSLAMLWAKYPGPVIPMWIERLAYRRHKVHILKPLTLPDLGEAIDEDVARDVRTLQFNQVLEELIRIAPEQYFWLHNRWK